MIKRDLNDISTYSYTLPPALIAQKPLRVRDNSKLLIVNRETKEFKDEVFNNLPCYIERGDCIVLNNTSVMPVRLTGHKEETGGKVDILLIERKNDYLWRSWIKPAKRVRTGSRIYVTKPGEKKTPVITIRNKTEDGYIEVDLGAKDHDNFLNRYGQTPLPPYINPDFEDDSYHRRRYQPVYARYKGAIASPTAGLHFTQGVFRELSEKNISIARVVLHVGVGTFAPIRSGYLSEHKMHSEWFHIPKSTIKKIESTHKEGKKVIAVGTTTTRALETFASDGRREGLTSIFIKPGFKFNIVDSLITNFHLPETTLIVLVSAFTGIDLTRKAYNHAVGKKYRFYSYGDAMLII